MSDDGFNMSMRKFLKRVGVTSQQAIEAETRAAREAGGTGTVNAKVVVTVNGKVINEVTGDIDLGGDA